MKQLRILLPLLLLAAAGASAAEDHSVIMCTGAKVYGSATSVPVEDALVVSNDGKITLVAPATNAKYQEPRSAQRLSCAGKFVVAGFWNSHIHFETEWENAATQPAAKLEAHMQEMLTRWGFTTVWDLGSLPSNSEAIRHRLDSGEIPGPKIFMAGDIFPKGGHPVYLPAEMQLPEAASPQEAEQMTQQYIKMGLDGLKLFTGSYMGNKPVVNMDTAIVKAAVDVAHGQGRPVFAHPQNHAGVDNALNGGVDVLAHTIPTEGSFTAGELEQMKRQHTALIPTLTLWTTVVSDPAVAADLVQGGVNELKAYSSEGGTILFGTDVGFQAKYDTTEEFGYMGRAMSWKQILASLTTAPSEYFKATSKGRVEPGMDADFVVLDGDPAADVKNFARVAYTVRGGKVIYEGK